MTRRRRPRCPKCRIGGYTESVATDGRPRFTCSVCDHTWTCGRTGGAYATPYKRLNDAIDALNAELEGAA